MLNVKNSESYIISMEVYKCPAYLWINYWMLDKSALDMAKENNVSKTSIYYQMKKFGIESKDRLITMKSENKKRKHRKYIKNHPDHLRGVNNHRWKGGRIKGSGGYIMILNHSHPNADLNGYVPEHRLAMEKHIGRYLKYLSRNHSENEIVHHINFDKEDNRIENLYLTTYSEHRKTNKTINNLIKPLMEKGIIKFEKGIYKLK